jgi:hypothetical protein
MAPATANRSSAPIKFLYPRRKRIRTLCQSETYAHSQSDARKSRDHKARSSLYAAPKKFSVSGLRAIQAGAIFSLILRAILYMFPFRPKRGLVSAKNLPYKETTILSAAHQQHMPCRPGRFLLCGCNQGPLCFSIGKIGNPLRHHVEQRLSRPRVSRIGGRFILGETGTFAFNPNKRWGLPTKTTSLGMKCREPKPNSRRIGLKALSVGMGRDARPPLEADQL